ncbi:MAG: glutamate 5-kinase [Alphaproteobacteria bacterium]|nr:glutamate 5-kinase [Alphaproteobacteria bacterium]MBT7943908.1 glutamate 5-kinase [Alphaproteobacteria bacterium]
MKKIENGRRIVVKIGSALLADQEHGTVHRNWLDALAQDVNECRQRGQEVVLVSSGAIAIGRRRLSLPPGPLKLDDNQAAAAAGMVRLAHAYEEALGAFDITVGQVLLTLDDTESRRRYINARNTLEALLKLGAVPLINENDTVATDEIRFGDNDRLAARVAAMVSADTLVLLSDIDGLYTADPRSEPDAAIVPEVTEITPAIEAMAGAAPLGDSKGGMVTKLAAAKVCLANGCRMVIMDGNEAHPLQRLQDGAPATWFLPSATPKTARKRWIAGALSPNGAVVLDEGAEKALGQGKSLLPAGVVAIEGDFQRGDAVLVKNRDGRELGRGLITYGAEDARLIMGHKTSEIESLLGYRGRDVIIHRDDLVLD